MLVEKKRGRNLGESGDGDYSYACLDAGGIRRMSNFVLYKLETYSNFL